MAFELEKIATAIGGEGNGFEMERISEAVENGAGGSGGSDGGVGFIIATSTVENEQVVLNIKPSDVFDNNNNVAKIVFVRATNDGMTTCMMGLWYTTNGSDDSQIKFYTGSGVDIDFTSADFNNGYFTAGM